MSGSGRSADRGDRNGGMRRANGADTYAAIDLGTNNCRLLVARRTDAGFQVIDAFSRIVRLGEGLGDRGALSDAAIGRTISALRVCATKMRRNRVTAARSVATAACRQASNCVEFLNRVRRETGVDLEIISSDEEARLALAGCMALLDPTVEHALVFDIGGGSTELIWTRQANGGLPTVLGSVSLPHGVVGLSERFGGRDVSQDAYRDMVEEVSPPLDGFDAEHGIAARIAAGATQIVGTSGTVTTLTALHLGLPRYDRAAVDGSVISLHALRAVIDRLAVMSYRERVGLGCVGRERADLVIAGSAILDAICRRWPVGQLTVADRGLREGILHGLMGAPAAQSLRH